MNRRFRTVAALVTLLALSASFAEQVWASTCDRTMQAADQADAGAMIGMHHETMPRQAPTPASNPDESPPDCPLAAALAITGGWPLAYRPSTAPAPPLVSETSSQVLTAPRAVVELLLAAPPFHPPKL